MKTPLNGETFLPSLLAQWLNAQAIALGLMDGLSIVAAPNAGAFASPLFEFGCPQFKLPRHDAIQELELHTILHNRVDGEAATDETDAAKEARRAAVLVEENKTIALIRAAIALKAGEKLDTVTPGVYNVDSFFDWCTARTVPNDEDGWALQSLQITGLGGALLYDEKVRVRRRTTQYSVRLMTNEFTV